MSPKCNCPYCEQDFDAIDLQQPAGPCAGSYCPKFQQRELVCFPHARIVATISLLLASGFSLVLKVQWFLWFVGRTAALWIPISPFLNAYSASCKPPILKKWKDRQRKTFNSFMSGTGFALLKRATRRTRIREGARLSRHSLYAKILLRSR